MTNLSGCTPASLMPFALSWIVIKIIMLWHSELLCDDTNHLPFSAIQQPVYPFTFWVDRKVRLWYWHFSVTYLHTWDSAGNRHILFESKSTNANNQNQIKNKIIKSGETHKDAVMRRPSYIIFFNLPVSTDHLCVFTSRTGEPLGVCKSLGEHRLAWYYCKQASICTGSYVPD